MTGQRFTVRKQSSGYTFRESFYDRLRRGRVTQGPLLHAEAVARADSPQQDHWMGANCSSPGHPPSPENP